MQHYAAIVRELRGQAAKDVSAGMPRFAALSRQSSVVASDRSTSQHVCRPEGDVICSHRFADIFAAATPPLGSLAACCQGSLVACRSPAVMEPLLPLIGLLLVAALVALAVIRIRGDARSSAIVAIDRMDGPAFEQYLVDLFRRLGFTVKHVGARNDYGADLIVERNESRIAVQAKARKDYVAISAVQQALGARFYYDCDGSLVVTNRYFSTPAKTLARKADVALWDRDQLVAAILQADSQDRASPQAA